MHYCSAEVESCSTHSEKSAATESYASAALQQGSGSPHPPTRPQFSFTHQLRPRPSPTTPVWKSSLSSSLPTAFTIHSVFNHAVSSPPSQNNRNNYFTSTYSPPSKEYPAAEREDGCFGTEQDLEDSLEELSEGIDVLQILERAYDKTLKAHVVSHLILESHPHPCCVPMQSYLQPHCQNLLELLSHRGAGNKNFS